MRREQTLEEISDGKLYDSNDMVKADCHDCEGCCDCCQGMGDSVLLDPYDVYRLSAGLQKWVDTPDLKKYEKFVNDWHYFLLDVQEVLYNAEDPDLIRNLNLFVVNRFYLKPYDQNQDFYIQFYERLKEGKELLALA